MYRGGLPAPLSSLESLLLFARCAQGSGCFKGRGTLPCLPLHTSICASQSRSSGNHRRRLIFQLSHANLFLLTVIIACHFLIRRLERQHLLCQQSVIPVRDLHINPASTSQLSAPHKYVDCNLCSMLLIET